MVETNSQEIEKPYTKFWIEWSRIQKLKPSGRQRGDRNELFGRVTAGKFGSQVRHSIFGIGDYDPNYDHCDERIAEINRKMKFYARMEK
jgi:hypothetical protein